MSTTSFVRLQWSWVAAPWTPLSPNSTQPFEEHLIVVYRYRI